MAKPSRIPFEDAIAGLDCDKFWPAGRPIDWIAQSQKKFPSGYSFRTSLLVDGRHPEGLFIELFWKPSIIQEVPDKVCMQLMVNNSVVLAIHENGHGRHLNKVGRGMPFFRQTVGHPHVHFPVPDASYGYSEPIERVSVDDLWANFLARGNVIGAPPLASPDYGQRPLI